ncbi:hypothetical protein [Marmoricola sp. RAF53]|uniref:hypothetical protein n=1 Tax=Marmoricola sp. RAF53 TaxID=3233059 RepID=UPI003F9B75E2
MNRTATRILVLAGPIAAAVLAVAPAHAVTPAPQGDPVIVLPPAQPDPKPMDIAQPTPKPQPKPNGPADLAIPKPKPQPPKGPKDLADAPKSQDPAPQPGGETGGSTGGQTGQGGQGGQGDGNTDEVVAVAQDATTSGKTASATAVTATQAGGRTFDTGVSDSGLAPATAEDGADNGVDLTWAIAGLGLAGATGLVLVARRRRQAEQA